MKRILFASALVLFGATFANAQEVAEVDNQYIQLDANQEPINKVNLTLEDLQAQVGELEPILETDAFQLYAAGDYTYRVQDGVVVSETVQIADDADDNVVYNRILNALAKSKPIRDTHNTGGNFYQYANFQLQFDDFKGYTKLTFQALPSNTDLTENNE
ncbi:MAG: hypothetical protein IJ710_10250 [Prevotella sp.]|nr:hypothetical protein [Prevotella sp.]